VILSHNNTTVAVYDRMHIVCNDYCWYSKCSTTWKLALATTRSLLCGTTV